MINRRSFIKGAGVTVAAASAGCRTCCKTCAAPHFRKPGDKLNVGIIGVGGKGQTDWTKIFAHGENIACFCDPDKTIVEKGLAKLKELGGDPSQVKCYQDYRKMIDENPNLDAVTISTPDHGHAAQAIYAMRSGINVYVQKPLVRTLWELKQFDRVARETGVITQMGNQGSAGMGHRRNVELLQQGVIGDVREIHVWTDRPIWPQGNTAAELVKCPGEKPPDTFDWDIWLGTAKARPFIGNRPASVKVTFRNKWAERIKGVYHQFNWRAFYDFGTGAFGDMACHTFNLPFRGCELGRPLKAECRQIVEKNNVAYPVKSIVEVLFAARKSAVRKGVTLPETKLVWYDGDQQPSADLMPQYVATFGKVPMTGCLILGSKGMMISTNDYGQEAFIALNGEKGVKSTTKHAACKDVAEIIVKNSLVKEQLNDPFYAKLGCPKGDLDFVQKAEFCNAIKGLGPIHASVHSRCFADREHSVPMLEGMLVGCIAQQVPGVLNWDSDNQVFDNAAANALVKPYIRSGWGL